MNQHVFEFHLGWPAKHFAVGRAALVCFQILG